MAFSFVEHVARNMEETAITVMVASDQIMAKQFFLKDDGAIGTDSYPLISTFRSFPMRITSLDTLHGLIQHTGAGGKSILIQGVSPNGPLKKTPRNMETFPPHPEGAQLVMLDIDGIPVPEGMSVLSTDAIEWLIAAKLPPEFSNVRCIYQFSNSAGIKKPDGTPLKMGLRVHLFFMLAQRANLRMLAGYLQQHCLDTGFYSIGPNKGGVVALTYGIDMSLLVNSVQPHYIAPPVIGDGIECDLAPEDRLGFIQGEQEAVVLPEIDPHAYSKSMGAGANLRIEWQKANGYIRTATKIMTKKGPVTTVSYRAPGQSHELRRGRELRDIELKEDKCILYFTDENSAGSWFVRESCPHLAERWGYGPTVPLTELSEDAYNKILELGWITDGFHQSMTLTPEGYLPEFSSFIVSRYSLILAPTGSGKTYAAIQWMKEKQNELTIVYVAQTIPLVDQMYQDLTNNNVTNKVHYTDFHSEYSSFSQYRPRNAVIVTTNESLPGIFKRFEEMGEHFYLIIDEVHLALDDFARNNTRLKNFESAMQRARACLFMTGTFTDTQHMFLASRLSSLNGGVLTHTYYTCYDFAPVKQNPLFIRKLAYFQADVVQLFENLALMLANDERLPRVVLIMNTSRMEVFRKLVETYGLEDLAQIVSRQECLPEDIEQARVGTQPILIASPIFSVGLNFECPPEIFWCRFDKLNSDTSRIVQTINRANRNEVACNVAIYVEATSREPFRFPLDKRLEQELRARFEGELPLVNPSFDMPLLLNRKAYSERRNIEMNPVKALGHLIEYDAFQNYTVVEEESYQAGSKADNELFKAHKKISRATYDEKVIEYRYRRPMGFMHSLLQLENVARTRKTNFKAKSAMRTARDIEGEELANVMELCQLADEEVQLARKVKVRSLRILMGEITPYLGDQFSANHYTEWGKAAALKTTSLLTVLAIVKALRSGRMDGFDFAKHLTRSSTLRAGFEALATSEPDWESLNKEFDELKLLRAAARESSANREAAQKLALEFTEQLLERIGIFFPREKVGRETIIDFTQPRVPSHWNFDEIERTLRQRGQMFNDLPSGHKKLFDENDAKDQCVSYSVLECEDCRFLDNRACVLGNLIEWSPFGLVQARAREVEMLHKCPNRSATRGLEPK